MKGCLKTGVYVLLGIFAFAFIVASMDGDVEEKPENYKTESYALIYAENRIEANLKAPSTADFGGIRNSSFRREGDTFYVKSFVDSQNGFGAMIRSHWEVRVEFIGENVGTSIISFE